jgi:hypothetical protein
MVNQCQPLAEMPLPRFPFDDTTCIAVRSLPFAIGRQPTCAQLAMMVGNQKQIFGYNKYLIKCIECDI